MAVLLQRAQEEKQMGRQENQKNIALTNIALAMKMLTVSQFNSM